MLRAKLTTTTVIVCMTIIVPIVNAGAFGDIVNGSINKAVGNIGMDSFFNIKCSDIGGDVPDFKFDIFGCEIDLSSKKCYTQTTDSFKDVLKLRRGNFNKNKACESYLSKEKQYFLEKRPFSQSSVLEVKKVPDTILSSEKIISQESSKMVSADFLAPKNSLNIKNKLKSKILTECSLASNSDECALSKSIKYAAKLKEDYDKANNTSFEVINKYNFVATAREGEVYVRTNKILSRFPIEKKVHFATTALKDINTDVVKNTLLNTNNLAYEGVLSSFSNIIAMSVSLDDRQVEQKVATESTNSWSLP